MPGGGFGRGGAASRGSGAGRPAGYGGGYPQAGGFPGARGRAASGAYTGQAGDQGAGGFVQLTGEVGTGKTTLCRCLLEQVPDDTIIALILNPMITPKELLATICEELGVAIDGIKDSSKALVDALNVYLLHQHAEGKRVVVVIDEAQNLSPDALEQVRLLTNLETAKHKLLQMVLLGQPELRQLLQRQNLRQLHLENCNLLCEMNYRYLAPTHQARIYLEV